MCTRRFTPLVRYVGTEYSHAESEAERAEGEFSDITKCADIFLDLGAFSFPTVLIDTPGVNDPFLVRDEITRQNLELADIETIRNWNQQRRIARLLHRHAKTAERPRIGGEIGVTQIGRDDAPREMALLMHADRAGASVVADDDHNRQFILHGRRELLPVHQEIAVAVDRHHQSTRKKLLHRHRRRNAVTHAGGGRRYMRPEAPKAVIAMNSGGVIARAIADDRVVWKIVVQPQHDPRQIDIRGRRALRRKSQIVLMRDNRSLAPGNFSGGRKSLSARANARGDA